jgi:hypothetical protein
MIPLHTCLTSTLTHRFEACSNASAGSAKKKTEVKHDAIDKTFIYLQLRGGKIIDWNYADFFHEII